MRKATGFFLIMAMILTTVGGVFAADRLLEGARQKFKPIPDQPPRLAGNPATPVKVELGKILFFDPRLSGSALISCNTCHNLGLGGDDFQQTSIGHGWQREPRNASTVLNAIYNIAHFWDGRARDLAEQAKEPIQEGDEMNNTKENVIKTLKSMPGYVTLFKQAFPGQADPVTFDNMAKAIEVFEATLITPDAPFDRFLKGDVKALNVTERQGLALFMKKIHNKRGCVDCHGGVNMGGDDYYKFGVAKAPPPEVMAGDVGRYQVTHLEGDRYVFRSPPLRNIELTAPYFHSGVIWSLREAVAIMSTSELGKELSPAEIEQIVAFLKATTGRQPEVIYPALPKPTDDTPKPIPGKSQGN